MTFEQLRVFLEIARCGSFTKAAARLGISQAAASATITTLESRYKTHFLDRKNRQDLLTPSGHILREEGEKILASFEAFRSRLEKLGHVHLGHLRIAASETALRYWLPPLVELFARQHPQISLTLQEGSLNQIANAIAVGSADIGIVEHEWSENDFVVETLRPYRLAIVVGTQHPWFGLPRIDWKDLTLSAWICREAGSATRQLFESMLADQGLQASELDTIVSLPSNEAIVSAIQHGASAAVLPEFAVALAVEAGVLWQIPSIPLHSTLNALTYQGRDLPFSARAFLDFVRGHIAQARSPEDPLPARDLPGPQPLPPG